MIKIEHTEVFGWEAAIRGMRNPFNSWDKSDSEYPVVETDCNGVDWFSPYYKIGPNDLTLMKKLVKAGTDHSKFMRMINVTVDITAPLYWWKEFDTYKVGTVANSCSTMHKIHEKEFELSDFSCEHLFDGSGFYFIKDRDPLGRLKETIDELNFWRQCFIDEESALGSAILYKSYGQEMTKKDYWWQMIQLLPSSYNQKRTVQLTYAVLRNMYHSRGTHKLDEWCEGLCKWIEDLPYSELITE